MYALQLVSPLAGLETSEAARLADLKLLPRASPLPPVQPVARNRHDVHARGFWGAFSCNLLLGFPLYLLMVFQASNPPP